VQVSGLDLLNLSKNCKKVCISAYTRIAQVLRI
jgi:hypothetical protein